MLNKKELIKNFILNPNPEERKLRFEIAWDIWENFQSILHEKSFEVFKSLKEKVEEIISPPYIVTYIDFGSLYVAKEFWKENEKDRGIYSIGIEKWDRDWITVGIVKNQLFNVDLEEKIRAVLTSKGLKSVQWFPGYLPISDWFSSNKEYYFKIFLDFEEVLKEEPKN